jgi:selenocysteine lyase/cysteine desulfurase
MSRVSRRTVLGAGLSAGALAGCTAPASPAFDPQDWASVRAQFALDPGLAHFAAFVLASSPAPVRAAIDRHRAGLDLDTQGYLQDDVRFEEAARNAAGAYLGVPAGEIALTDSTTMGTGLLCAGLRLRPDQSVVTTTHDFFGTHESLRLLSERTGAQVTRATLYDDPAVANEGDIVSRLHAAIAPRTRVVVVTWVHSSTGVRLPIKAISSMLAGVNASRDPADRALLCVDGVHGFAAVDAGPADLGCDFLTTGTHKWLFGPRGTGILWAKAWDTVSPVIPSFSSPDSPGQRATPGGYHSFENRWAVKEAFDFHTAIGRPRIAARIQEQATRLKSALATMPTVKLATPQSPNLSAGLVMCSIAGLSPRNAVRRLRTEHKIVASVTPYNDPLLRFGPSIVTTPEQVDQVIKAVAALK